VHPIELGSAPSKPSFPITRVAGSRHYAVTTADGQLDIVVFDRDQQAAGTFYRIYRSVRLLAPVSRSAPLSVDRVVERRALLSYAARGRRRAHAAAARRRPRRPGSRHTRLRAPRRDHAGPAQSRV